MPSPPDPSDRKEYPLPDHLSKAWAQFFLNAYRAIRQEAEARGITFHETMREMEKRRINIDDMREERLKDPEGARRRSRRLARKRRDA
jgi:hypothetical protein